MKELAENSRVCGYLEKIFKALNTDKFGGELEVPIITVQNTSKAYGHLTCNKVWHNAHGVKQYELNIGAGTLDRPIENVVSTMLHEMVHLYNQMHDVQDCSRGNTYHNKKFKEKAEEIGLIIGYDKRIGWSVTSPSDELVAYIAKRKWENITLGRDEKMSESTGKKSSTRKYVCPCCGMSVRATREVHISCMDCNVKLEVEE